MELYEIKMELREMKMGCKPLNPQNHRKKSINFT